MITLNVQEESVLLHAEQVAVVGGSTNTDNIPTKGSENAVSSNGVYVAIGAGDHVKAEKVRFDDGETFQQKLENGSLKGEDGYTPVKGTDYWTTADKQEIVDNVLEQVGDGGSVPKQYEQFDVRNFSGGNLTSREGFYTYRDNGTNFTYTMPYPQQGAVTITLKFERDVANADKETWFKFVYSDGTSETKKNCYPGTVYTFVSDANKTLVKFTGSHNNEQLVYLDLSVMSIVSDYSVPEIMVGATASSAGKYGFVPAPAAGDQDKVLAGNGQWKALKEAIPVPVSAAIGQTIKVSAVDANGKPTAWEAVNFPAGGGGGETPDEYVVLFNKTFEAAVLNTDAWGGESHIYGFRHFWTTDVDGNDVDADGIYARIHVPAQTGDAIVSSGELSLHVGQGKPSWWGSWRGGDQQQPYIGWSSFVSTNGQEVWCTYDVDLREQTYRSQKVMGKHYDDNVQLQYVSNAPMFPDAIARNKWEYLSGAVVFLVSGSLPAGTNILIYARKRNPDKVGKLPKWSVVT